MDSLESDVHSLKEKNSDLALQLQFYKELAAQRDKEKHDLIKELNELRLKISRLRGGGAAEVRKLDAGLQAATEEALSHLVQASSAVARNLELSKQYIQHWEELDSASPRWNCHNVTPNSEKVHRVPPLLIGGQSIQPVVSLSRTMFNSSLRSRTPTQNVTQRPVPMHMLQDVYIPLTRIDMAELQSNSMEADADGSEDMGMDEDDEDPDDSHELPDELDASRRLLGVVAEDPETEGRSESPHRSRLENPLEGPSWLLDVPNERPRTARSLEPDSTTPCGNRGSLPAPAARTPRSPSPQPSEHSNDDEKENEPLSRTLVFSPTVRRRRKRPASPAAPRTPNEHNTAKGNNILHTRVLKVVLAKMRLSDTNLTVHLPAKRAARRASPAHAPLSSTVQLDGNGRASDLSSTSEDEDSPRLKRSRRRTLESPFRGWQDSSGPPESSPTVRESSPIIPMSFDAPSPNGATDAGVIVFEASRLKRESRDSCEPLARVANRLRSHRDSRQGYDNTRDSRQDNDSLNESTRQVKVHRETRQDHSQSPNDSETNEDLTVSLKNRQSHDKRSQSRQDHDKRSQRLKDRETRQNRSLSNDSDNESEEHTPSRAQNRQDCDKRSQSRQGHDKRSQRRQDNHRDTKQDRSLSRQDSDSGSETEEDAPNRARSRPDRDKRSQSRQGHDKRSQSRQIVDQGQGNRSQSRQDRPSPECDSDHSGAGGRLLIQNRSQRPRKNVTYKEKPLNRKLRR